MTESPSLAQIADQLRGLLSGTIRRGEASAWAARWLTADNPGIEDDVAWQALERIGGADLPGGETEYLFQEADFHAWLDDVEDAIDARG